MKIQNDIKGKCAQQNEFDFFVADSYARSFRENYECMIKTLGEASMKNGLTTQWKKYEPKIKQHFDAWKQCEQSGGKLKKL